MRVDQFLEHYHVVRNPFAEEDAQTDPVFKDHCIDGVFHPTWDKVFGDPHEPATSIIFGEKGSGKTAIRLQITKRIQKWNRENPAERVFLVEYDDFNNFLDRFHDRVGLHKPTEWTLKAWKLWDHMDSILSLGVTNLVDAILQVPTPAHRQDIENPIDREKVPHLEANQKRDLLLLAACYDHSTRATFSGRWQQLRHRMRFFSLAAWWDLALGIGWTILVILAVIAMINAGWIDPTGAVLTALLIVVAVVLIGWLPRLWRWLRTASIAWRVTRNVRIGNTPTGQLRGVLMHLPMRDLAGQPLPLQPRTDDRFEMLAKFQNLLESFGYRGMLVLVDRVDEPHLINGVADNMKALVWPMLDNKLLKHPGVGFKVMLPSELIDFVDREDREFYQRSHLDKQNVIRSFQWTPQALLDVANARIEACTRPGTAPTRLRDWIDPAVSDQRILEAIGSLRVPRQMFKFLYHLIVTHANAYSAGEPQFKITPEMFETQLALFRRGQEAFDRGLGAGA